MTLVPSPCVGVCNSMSQANGICTGCFRLTEEIIGWNNFSQEKKDRILKVLKLRKIKYAQIGG